MSEEVDDTNMIP